MNSTWEGNEFNRITQKITLLQPQIVFFIFLKEFFPDGTLYYKFYNFSDCRFPVSWEEGVKCLIW